MRRFLAIIQLGILAAGYAIPSYAVAGTPHAVQVSCDSLGEGGALREIAFSLQNPSIASVCYFALSPQSDSCLARSCQGPEPWVCFPDAGQGLIYFEAAGSQNCIPPSSELGPFVVVLEAEPCCFRAQYFHNGIPDPISDEIVCFGCEGAVQTRSETWGRIKVMYR